MKVDFRHRCLHIARLGIVALGWVGIAPCLDANPTGGTVTQGSATFNTSGSRFTINQNSPSAFINWGTFNIAAGETTTFNQPSASSIAWNQINDSNPSQILGNLNANGYVVLQNANGFYIGGQAAITTHGLIMTTASTPALDLSSGGPWSFNTPPPTAKIINYGRINITGGGSAFLIADDIVNGGEISAPGGKIGLYAGQTVLVSTSPDGRGLSAKVTLPQGSVDNEGKLIADGGSIAAQARMVNQNGLVQANSAQNVNGTIELVAGGSVNLGATSVISAQGDTQGISSGGSVIIKSGQSFSDQPGSVIDIAGGAAGGNGGQAEISAPQMGDIHSSINGQAPQGFGGGTLTIDPLNIWLASANTDPAAPSDYSVVNVHSFSGLSQINLEADNNIALNTLWSLPDAAAVSTLSLAAGNDITFNLNSGINAGQNWSVNLTAGTSFVPTTAQLAPASGSAGIYLDGSSIPSFSAYVRTQNGDINLWAANEVQVGWSGVAQPAGLVNSGSGGVTTKDGGNISVTTVHGDVNTGSSTSGYIYRGTAPYFSADPNLGGISTVDGGNVTIAAGGNVISYLPSGSASAAAADAGTGAFGQSPGNVTITAAGSVYGHYVLTDGTGTVTAGQNVGAAGGNPFALSLASGGWSINAPYGNIYLQEVRNPNGVFNNVSSFLGSAGKFLFTYAPQAYVDLTGNGVYLTSLNVPRPYGAVPVLYPPVLNITAGSGGVTLEGNVTLFPSTDQNLSIITTDGGNFSATASLTSPYQLMMSDSALNQWVNANSFGNLDHGGIQNEPNDSSPVVVNISGDMEDLNLITTKATQITVGGDMINCGFSGQNLQASDHTSITVAGQIFNTSPYSFVNLSQVIPSIPTANLLAGMGNSWDDIFTLAVNPTLLATPAFLATLQQLPVSQWASYALQATSLFGEQIINGQLVGVNPGFVYDPATGRLGFAGPMKASALSALSQPITVLHLVNGQAVIDTNPGDHSPGRTYGQIETDTVSWADPAAVQTLFAASQGNPSLATVQLGYRIGGPGYFDVNAGSISLGNSDGILSCGVYDAQGGFNRYHNLTSITPSGATLNVTVTGDLDMLTSTIAALDGGDVNVSSTGGSMDLGSAELFNSDSAHSGIANAHLAFGIYTTGGGDVNVNALDDIDINGSRIATYNGGNILIESQQGDVNVGSGTAALNTAYVAYVNPTTGQAAQYVENVFGSGIVANTLVPPQHGQAFPPDSAALPGNITVITPQGDIISTKGGILQAALDGSITAGPTVTLEAGTPQGDDWSSTADPLYVGNIDLGSSGVIGGTVTLKATGDIIGQVVSRQNSTVTAGQNFSGTLLSGGSASVSGGGTVSGTIIGVGGANVSGGSGVSASVLGQNVSVNGGAATSTLGSSAGATAGAQSAAGTTSSQNQQAVAANSDQDSDDDKKKKKGGLVRKVGRVTVILSTAVSPE